MCGRFTLTSPADVVAELFELIDQPAITPRYNIAPTQPIAVVVAGLGDRPRRCELMHWGLIPSWAKDPGIGSRMINARAETVAQKPSFRSAFRKRRCLVVADGFYEWQKLPGGKQPHYIQLTEAKPFAFAGLWERWPGKGGDAIDSCTIITTEPNELMATLHNRMPVILSADDYAQWLDPTCDDRDSIQSLLRPYAANQMTAHPVSTHVNSPRHEDAACVEPLS